MQSYNVATRATEVVRLSCDCTLLDCTAAHFAQQNGVGVQSTLLNSLLDLDRVGDSQIITYYLHILAYLRCECYVAVPVILRDVEQHVAALLSVRCCHCVAIVIREQQQCTKLLAYTNKLNSVVKPWESMLLQCLHARLRKQCIAASVHLTVLFSSVSNSSRTAAPVIYSAYLSADLHGLLEGLCASWQDHELLQKPHNSTT
eukprot:15113-Heterococcus_DN1.PRE.3